MNKQMNKQMNKKMNKKRGKQSQVKQQKQLQMCTRRPKICLPEKKSFKNKQKEWKPNDFLVS